MKLKATKPVTLRVPPFNRVYLTLVGAGGTGSHLASGLATIALALREMDISTDLRFIDQDIVEEKNIGRQLFTAADLGRNKALALAQRIGGAYGMGIAAISRFIDNKDTFLASDLAPGHAQVLNLVVGAVDNPAARALIAKAVERAQGQLWWADAGNENHSGQIALGNSVDPHRWRPALGMVDSLPAPHVIYPDLIKKAPKTAKRASCADATAAGEQGLMVNRMVAAWALSLLNDFLLGQLKYFTLAFDLEFGGTQSRALDEQTLKECAV